MEYPFWVSDFDRFRNYRDKYPIASVIFDHPQPFWYGPKIKKNMTGSIRRLLDRAHPKLPILVMYYIPNRDIGQHSRGGAKTRKEYLEVMHRFARGIGEDSPIVIYEPDALPHSTLLSKSEQTFRLDLMKESLEYLTDNCNGIFYVDVGHSNWLDPKEVAELLNKVSNPNMRGFSVNSCNYRTTRESIRWSKKILKIRKDDYFVVDTSRNGRGPYKNEWCNPSDRGVGHLPSCETSYNRCDAYLWIKVPGESDGKCNGGPKAGAIWGEQAEELVINSKYL
jgi:endoglucanase